MPLHNDEGKVALFGFGWLMCGPSAQLPTVVILTNLELTLRAASRPRRGHGGSAEAAGAVHRASG